MKPNIGSFEAAWRCTAAGGLLIAANHGVRIAAWLSIGLLVCAALRFCPLWWLLRIDTGANEKSYRRWPRDED
jgi:hypothetical protein